MCVILHSWEWPRRRGNKDVQVCNICGAERTSKVPFSVPMRAAIKAIEDNPESQALLETGEVMP